VYALGEPSVEHSAPLCERADWDFESFRKIEKNKERLEMKKSVIGLASLLLPALVGATATTGCDKVAEASEAACGPCGEVATGDVGISGNAKLDGFFAAVADLNKAQVAINADFEANIDELLATFGAEVAANADITAKVDALTAAIDAEVTANAKGALTINYVPPKCEANVSVAFSAQAQCEAKAECEVMADPGQVSVECSGTCEGSCEGTCTGGFKCEVSASGECSGSCEGSCQLEAAAVCEGTCKGDCSGTCSAYDGNQKCAGACDGMCTGTCELKAAAKCTGKCSGSCVVEAMADCEGEAPKCQGSCSGGCKGSCTGSATPPSASANCEATADCQAQAKAQGSANISCSPPKFEMGFEFKAGVDADAQAAFGAKLSALQVRGAAILQGFTKYQALIDGKVDGKVVFEPSPLAVVTGELEGVVSAGVKGKLFADIPAGRISCVIPALQKSVEMLGKIGTDAKANIAAQAKFAATLTGG
jgi:modification target Cys-rich repeat protein